MRCLLADSACPLMSWVHSSNITNVCDTASNRHVPVMSTIWCCLAAHFGDCVCFWSVLACGFHTATGVEEHAEQWAAPCALAGSVVMAGSSAGNSGTAASFVVDFPGVQLEHRDRGLQLHSETSQCHKDKQTAAGWLASSEPFAFWAP